MAEAALDVIGSPPGNDANAKWVFSEQESRDLAARVFGTKTFDVEHETDVRGKVTVNKLDVVRGEQAA
jgi:hypothetical protein